MGALGIPSAADIERLTRRLRSVSQRLEGIEDAVDRLDERLAVGRVARRRRRARRAGGQARGAPRRARPRSRCGPRGRGARRRAAAAGAGAPDRLRRPDDLAAQPLERRPGRLAQREPESPRPARSPARTRPRASWSVTASRHAARTPWLPRHLHHRGRLHLDDRGAVGRPRSPRGPRARHRRGRSRRTSTGARPAPPRARRRARRRRPRGRRRRARGSRRPRRSPRSTGSSVPSSRSSTQRAARADPDQRPRAQPDQLLHDDRRARPAHAGGLDRERRAVAARCRCSPTARGGG